MEATREQTRRASWREYVLRVVDWEPELLTRTEKDMLDLGLFNLRPAAAITVLDADGVMLEWGPQGPDGAYPMKGRMWPEWMLIAPFWQTSDFDDVRASHVTYRANGKRLVEVSVEGGGRP